MVGLRVRIPRRRAAVNCAILSYSSQTESGYGFAVQPADSWSHKPRTRAARSQLADIQCLAYN